METEMGPLSSLGTTSYRLPIVTIVLSLTVFALLRMSLTDGQTDGIALAKGGQHALKCIGRQKWSKFAKVIVKIKVHIFMYRSVVTAWCFEVFKHGRKSSRPHCRCSSLCTTRLIPRPHL